MDNTQLEQKASTLRLELKAWEKAFAAQHDGRKAGREDIKVDVTISLKYKEYNRVRSILSGKAAPQTPSKLRPVIRKPVQDTVVTPKKGSHQRVLFATPLKRKRDSPQNAAGEASSEKVDSPEGPEKIGPTPQRDGIVLGLFDLLSAETPSKRRSALSEVTANVLQTPRKSDAPHGTETSVETWGRGERTPQSVGKRFMLDKFVTPKKRKRGEHGTPSSSMKDFATPQFLRRDAVLEPITEDLEPRPRPAPWRRRGLGRSLSSMIQSLKKQEEDRLDEEADIMREMEMEAEGICVPKKAKKSDVLVEDSQQQMPLGVDGLESDDENDENKADNGLDATGQPRKVWKKRGQKRTTRRVIMKPAFVKPLPREDQVVPETKLDADQASGHDHALSDSDSSDSDYASDDSHTPKKRKIQHRKADIAPKQAVVEKTSATGSVKAVAKKISATAHANYRRLKIKSKGGNGGGGGKRFGRRR